MRVRLIASQLKNTVRIDLNHVRRYKVYCSPDVARRITSSKWDVKECLLERNRTGDFDFKKYVSLLHPGNRLFGKKENGSLLNHSYAPVIDSTQNLTRIRDIPNGSVFLADVQEAGKGRGRNAWISPHGCLSFSLNWRIARSENLVFVQYFISLVVAQVLNGLGHDIFRLKWPNDVYALKTKVGGVICNSEFDYSTKEFRVVVGIGVNVSNQKPFLSVNSALSKIESKPYRDLVSREEVLAKFMNQIDRQSERFLSEGFSPFLQDYYGAWLHSNQRVRVENGDEEVMITGISKANGYLTAVDSNGTALELHPELNSFNLLDNLLKKKLS